MNAHDNAAAQALSDAGAQCGVCGDQPGDRTCPECEQCYEEYVTGLRAAGWAPRDEVLTEFQMSDARELTARYRATVLREAADELVAYCPDHGNRDTCFMACQCLAADDLRRKADEVTAP